MTTDTALGGNYLALLVLAVLAAAISRSLLRMPGSNESRIRPADLFVIFLYAAGVFCLVRETDLLPQDLLLRAGTQLLLLAAGWWELLKRNEVNTPYRRFVLLTIVVPLMSGWASVGWLLELNSLAGVGLLTICVAILAVPIALTYALLRGWISRPQSRSVGVPTSTTGASPVRWFVTLAAAVVIMWVETRPVVLGDPFNPRSTVRGWARDTVAATNLPELKSWMHEYVERHRVPSEAVTVVAPDEWPQMVRSLHPDAVLINAERVCLTWKRTGRIPERGIVILTDQEAQQVSPGCQTPVRVLHDVYAWYGQPNEG